MGFHGLFFFIINGKIWFQRTCKGSKLYTVMEPLEIVKIRNSQFKTEITEDLLKTTFLIEIAWFQSSCASSADRKGLPSPPLYITRTEDSLLIIIMNENVQDGVVDAL